MHIQNFVFSIFFKNSLHFWDVACFVSSLNPAHVLASSLRIEGLRQNKNKKTKSVRYEFSHLIEPPINQLHLCLMISGV
jgi:hypothetical protein